MTDPKMIGVREAARNLGVHENTIRNWEKRGLLTATHLPSGIRRFSAEEVARMRHEMLTQFAPDTEMPPIKRPKNPGRPVNGGLL